MTDKILQLNACREKVKGMDEEELIEIVKEIPLSIMLNECIHRCEFLEAKQEALIKILGSTNM